MTDDVVKMGYLSTLDLSINQDNCGTTGHEKLLSKNICQKKRHDWLGGTLHL
jgi:hypothetical protein